MPDAITKKKLIRILHNDDFDALISLYAEMVDKWNEQSCVGENEFQTLKLVFMREGKKAGLKEFFNKLENPE